MLFDENLVIQTLISSLNNKQIQPVFEGLKMYKVLKFGGTSLRDKDSINAVCKIIKKIQIIN